MTPVPSLMYKLNLNVIILVVCTLILIGSFSSPHSAASTSTTNNLHQRVAANNANTLFSTEKRDTCGPRALCNNRGTCMIDRCFCDVGTSGSLCEEGTRLDCGALEDHEALLRCFFHAEFGSARVDSKTWQSAMKNEVGWWRNNAQAEGIKGDRHDEHIRGFKNYEALPAMKGGAHAEFGCGPYPQTLASLVATRPDITFGSITLLDPNIHAYLKEIPSCTFSNGTLLPGVPTYLVNAGAEAPLFREQFDSLLIINVLEHVQNAFAVLDNVWASLKPGGILIFQDRVLDQPFPLNANAVIREIEGIHPIRVRLPVFAYFASKFDVLFWDEVGPQECLFRHDECIYFIGRKR